MMQLSRSAFKHWLPIFFLVILATGGRAQDKDLNSRKNGFDLGWKFMLGDDPKAGSSSFDDQAWRKIDLPHDWSIEGQFHPRNPMGNDGGYLPAGTGWYRKSFVVPDTWKGKRISIYFEGVYMNAEVYINGKSLGVYPYGYSSFYYDLTPYLNEANPNVIAVKVDNSKQKNSRWYSGSGIYRHVWLMATDDLHIQPWGVSITTPRVAAKSATVEIRTSVKNETDQPQRFHLQTKLFSGNNQAGKNSVEVALEPRGEKEIRQTIAVSRPELWSPETPHLYQATVQLLKDNRITDSLSTRFGIRSLEFTANNGFRLNGKPVKLNGGCVHHDNGCLGAAAYDRAEERKVELMKAAGFNALRTSHNPPSEAFLEACDRQGMLVIDEAFDGWRTQKTKYDYATYFNQWAQKDVEALVKRDRNHPSIIMWSIGNEIIERKEAAAVETAKMLASSVKKVDTTRPVTSAMTTWDKDWAIFDPLMAAHDVAGYNYQLHHAASDHQRVPSRIIVQTESYPRDAFANWKLVQNNPYIIGDFVWTAMDYLGESGIGRWYYSGDVPGEHYDRDLFPWHGAYCGDVDLTGWRKPISHYRSMLYNGTEKLYLAVKEPQPAPLEIKETLWSVWPTWESWTWPGFEGRDLQVEVYTRYPKVRLYLNDQLLGEQAVSEDQAFKATFAVPYTTGELKAVGVMNDQVMETKVLKTAGAATRIKLAPDRTTLSASGQDLSFVTVQVTDADGNILPSAENRLQFAITGPGVIAGVDNANLKDTDSYASTSRKAWKGKALVVIKSTQQVGDVQLTVSSPGLPATTITLKTTR